MQILQQYTWPGNIRELENIIERQIILANSDKVNFDFLITQSTALTVSSKRSLIHNTSDNTAINSPNQSQLFSAQQHKLMEKQNLVNALIHCKGKIYANDGAAQLLGLKPTTLTSKLKRYDINRQNYIG